jgi:hypothetical protein
LDFEDRGDPMMQSERVGDDNGYGEENAHSDSGNKRERMKRQKKQFNKSKVFNRVIKGNIQNMELMDESENSYADRHNLEQNDDYSDEDEE